MELKWSEDNCILFLFYHKVSSSRFVNIGISTMRPAKASRVVPTRVVAKQLATGTMILMTASTISTQIQ